MAAKNHLISISLTVSTLTPKIIREKPPSTTLIFVRLLPVLDCLEVHIDSPKSRVIDSYRVIIMGIKMNFDILIFYKIIKADQLHLQDYLHKPPEYRHTNIFLGLVMTIICPKGSTINYLGGVVQNEKKIMFGQFNPKMFPVKPCCK